MNKLSVKSVDFVSKVSDWVKKNRSEAFLLTLILFLASYLRLYKIDQYMTFLGDEGRDVIVVRRLLVNFDPVLVGPGTSIGNMYLGPLYYYLMAPFLLLFNFSPVGPAVMIALLGIITVWFVWLVAREWFGKLAGFVAAVLYATAPVVITYSRSSWNPNIMPFFALLSIYSIWRIYKNQEFKWLLVLGLSFAFVLNSHYLGLLLIPTLALFWLLTFFKIRSGRSHGNWKLKFENLTKYSLFGLAVFCMLMSPLVIFDARHSWRNFEAIKTFFTVRQETVSIKPWAALPKTIPTWEKISSRLVTSYNTKFANFFALSSIIFLASYLFANIKSFFNDTKPKVYPFLILFFWLGFALIGFGLYKQEIYDHYYGFIFPAIFLLIGGIFQTFYDLSKFGGIILTAVFVPVLFINNIKNSPLKYSPNGQLQRSTDVSREIEKISGGREFNFAVIAERNYEGAYQYFFEKDGVPVVDIDPQRDKETVKDQLFVVCEMQKEKCDPVNNPKAGIANYGWSKIEFQEDFEGVTIYKLIHNI